MVDVVDEQGETEDVGEEDEFLYRRAARLDLQEDLPYDMRA